MSNGRARLVAALAAGAIGIGGFVAGHQAGAPSSPTPLPCPVLSTHTQTCAEDSTSPPAGAKLAVARTAVPPAAALAYSNGNIPDSALCPITGGVAGTIPGEGQLLCGSTAASWNAMSVYIHARTGVWLSTDGSASAYRPYSEQVRLRNYWCSLGKCSNAAPPGTSNHGLGTAVDNPNYSLIRAYGGQFHWGMGYGSCSDAPWENWHAHYCGGYTGSDPGPYGNGGGGGHTARILKLGDGGKFVFHLNCQYRHLHRPGHGPAYQHHKTHHFGPGMKRATQHFQNDHKLTPDGAVGPKTHAKISHRWNRYEKHHAKACGLGPAKAHAKTNLARGPPVHIPAASALTSGSVTRNAWAHQFLNDLGVPLANRTPDAYALVSWMQAEGGNATWNPLNTTWPEPGHDSIYNSVGVRNYFTESVGLDAVERTIKQTQSYLGFVPILRRLRREAPAGKTLTAVENSRWGTGGLAKVVLPYVKAHYDQYAGYTIAGS